MIPNPNNETGGFITSVSGWFAHPFNSQGSALNWLLFIGLLVIAAFLWNTVILQITE